MRVVFSYCAGGKNTATKRFVTMSNTARSELSRGARNGAGGNDCKVITHFGVVKDPFIRFDPIIIEHFARKWVYRFFANADLTVGK